MTALTPAEIDATADWISSVQLSDGLICWFEGGHGDPWNHVEAAMALATAGRRREAEAAYDWLAKNQLPDGSWCHYYLADGVEEPRRDPNACAYIATGAWWHYLAVRDNGFLEELWPVIDAALDFVVRLQRPGGEFLWSLDPDGVPGSFALLTGSASIYHSLRCGVAVAERLGHERPDWELAVARAGHAVAHDPDAFIDKSPWAMDWYYPVLCGAVHSQAGREHLLEGYDRFVMPGLGVRCIDANQWVTAAETSECVIALDAVGLRQEAIDLLSWTRHMRDDDGAYWTGCVHPECVRYPGGERTTYTAAAVVIADHILRSSDACAGIFRGDSLPEPLELHEIERIGER